jgi:hypothetical protein
MDDLIKNKHNHGYGSLWNRMECHGKRASATELETQFGMMPLSASDSGDKEDQRHKKKTDRNVGMKTSQVNEVVR